MPSDPRRAMGRRPGARCGAGSRDAASGPPRALPQPGRRSSPPGDIELVGYSSKATFEWTEAGLGACSVNRSIYCFQQRTDLPQEP